MKISFFTLVAVGLLAGAALAGCETAVDLPEPPHTPRVSLFFTLTDAPQDSAFAQLFDQRRLFVSNSQRLFSEREIKGRTDAAVELRDGTGAVVERYRSAPHSSNPYASGEPGFYRPTLGFRPRPGQAYTLRATLPGMETAESSLVMPQAAVVESGSFTPRTGSTPGSNEFRGRLNVVVRDNPATTDYYLAYARVLDRQGLPGPWAPVDVDYDAQGDAVSVGQFQLSSPQQARSISPFADTGVKGQRFSLVTDVRFGNYCPSGCPQPGYIEVYVSSITAATYNFYLSRRRYLDSDGNPFAEPAPLASNVRAGYGLFGGAVDTTYRIRIF